MDVEDHKAAVRATSNALQETFARHADVLGPTEENDDGVVGRVPSAVLKEWVLILSWEDAEDDDMTYTTRLTSPGMPRHHETGLLHETLYDFD